MKKGERRSLQRCDDRLVFLSQQRFDGFSLLRPNANAILDVAFYASIWRRCYAKSFGFYAFRAAMHLAFCPLSLLFVPFLSPRNFSGRGSRSRLGDCGFRNSGIAAAAAAENERPKEVEEGKEMLSGIFQFALAATEENSNGSGRAARAMPPKIIKTFSNYTSRRMVRTPMRVIVLIKCTERLS